MDSVEALSVKKDDREILFIPYGLFPCHSLFPTFICQTFFIRYKPDLSLLDIV